MQKIRCLLCEGAHFFCEIMAGARIFGGGQSILLHWASHNVWFQVQHYIVWTKLTFACKIETSGSLYSHALLIIEKSNGAWAEV